VACFSAHDKTFDQAFNSAGQRSPKPANEYQLKTGKGRE
jgi:hypothetical protein